MKNLAWHFTGATLRDGSPIPAVGETLIYKGKVKICRSGYHWSRTPAQALEYAPGNLLHLVEVEGVVTEQKDKGVSVKRTILKTVDVSYLLRRYAADEALSVKHLWEMPPVVEQYLTSLNESLRAAAWDAAWAAARTAARDAAGDASCDAAGAAARAAAWDAARTAARDAAGDAACDAAGAAARDAAGGVACDAACDAAWDAAWDAARGVARGVVWGVAWDAARAAAWAAAWAVSENRFNNLVYKEFCFNKDTGSFS